MAKVGDVVQIVGTVQEIVHLQGEEYNLRLDLGGESLWVQSKHTNLVFSPGLVTAAAHRFADDLVGALHLRGVPIESEEDFVSPEVSSSTEIPAQEPSPVQIPDLIEHLSEEEKAQMLQDAAQESEEEADVKETPEVVETPTEATQRVVAANSEPVNGVEAPEENKAILSPEANKALLSAGEIKMVETLSPYQELPE